MRSFVTMFKSDLRHGFAQVVLRHILVLFVALFVTFMSYSVIGLVAEAGHLEITPSLGDVILCLLGGMIEYDPASGREFEAPIAWLALLVATAYVTLDYPLRDLHGIGATTIVVSGSRWSWWFSKCCWVICNAIVICAEWFVVIGVFALIGNCLPDFAPTHTVVMYLGFFGKGGLVTPGSLGMFAVSLVPLVAALLLFQLVVSLFVGPYIALAVSVGVMFLSAFYMNPLLLGEYLMGARTNALVTTGVDSLVGIAFGIGLSLICVVGGGIVFKHKDILAGKARSDD